MASPAGADHDRIGLEPPLRRVLRRPHLVHRGGQLSRPGHRRPGAGRARVAPMAAPGHSAADRNHRWQPRQRLVQASQCVRGDWRLRNAERLPNGRRELQRGRLVDTEHSQSDDEQSQRRLVQRSDRVHHRRRLPQRQRSADPSRTLERLELEHPDRRRTRLERTATSCSRCPAPRHRHAPPWGSRSTARASR